MKLLGSEDPEEFVSRFQGMYGWLLRRSGWSVADWGSPRQNAKLCSPMGKISERARSGLQTGIWYPLHYANAKCVLIT